MNGKILKRTAAAVLSLALMGGALPALPAGSVFRANAVIADEESPKKIEVGLDIFLGDYVDFGEGAYYYTFAEYSDPRHHYVEEEVHYTKGIAQNISRGNDDTNYVNELWSFNDGSGRFGENIFNIMVKRDNVPEIRDCEPIPMGIRCVSGDGSMYDPYLFEAIYENGLSVGDVLYAGRPFNMGSYRAFVSLDYHKDINSSMMSGDDLCFLKPVEHDKFWEFVEPKTNTCVTTEKNGNKMPVGLKVVSGTGWWNDDYIFEAVYDDPNLLYGDVDGDGAVRLADAICLYKYIHARTDDMDSEWIEYHGDLFRRGDGIDDYDVMELIQCISPYNLPYDGPINEVRLTDNGNGGLYSYEFTNRVIYPEVTFTNNSMTLGGAISLNFYVNFSDLSYGHCNDSYVEFEVNGKKQTAKFDHTKLSNNGSDYYFTCKLNAVSLADEVKATLHYFDNRGEEKTVTTTATAESYLEKFDEYDDPELWSLITSINDYGYYMQPYLAAHSGQPWTLGEDHIKMKKSYVPATEYLREYRHYMNMLEYFRKFKDLGDSDLSNITYALIMDSDTALRFTIKPQSGYTGPITVYLDGNKVTPKKVGSNYQVTVSGISAHKLGDPHMLTVETKNGTAEFGASALSYAYDAVTDPLDSSEKLAMCALYDYYSAAKAYKKSDE